ncbi:hypothetical protein RB623_21020 [Mesorhizobium sp. LHD-90]|uniref:hypothetical protein n=1 Tax=Mesorhizobium sp. LHD-90 TaxID=3071414 RepID=UPI0027E16E4D|nr:hypothetical protein [Mesorhizobium sp. LHD-90]MDQ6436540.1 hypothetical protein [Mesorhizobium sp. LHD-90]
MIRAALLFPILLGLGHPAFAEDVQPESCTGQNCAQQEGRQGNLCEGQDCAPPAPAQAEVECIGQDCDAIQNQPADGNGG